MAVQERYPAAGPSAQVAPPDAPPSADGSRVLLSSLCDEGVDVIFGYPGGQVIPIYDALLEFPIRHVLVRHEQGAAHAADGYARASGRVGVCLATSGPGAINLVAGLANAMMDSVPVVAVVGQVPSRNLGKDAFQEADLSGLAQSVAKHSYLVGRPRDLARVVKEAFHIASTGRPGPVLIGVPQDVQVSPCDYRPAGPVRLPGYKPTCAPNPYQVARAARAIASASRPVLLAGGGVVSSGAAEVLVALARKAAIPVTNTLLGLGSFPPTDPLFLGMAGMHGALVANRALAEADLIVAVGTRFPDRVTGAPALFAPKAAVIHIDIDPAEVGKNIRVDVPVVGDARLALEAIARMLSGEAATPRPAGAGTGQPTGATGPAGATSVGAAATAAWLREIENWRREVSAPAATRPGDSTALSPHLVMDRLAAWLDDESIVVTDVGQHQMWAAQRLPIRRPRSFLTSGGLGAMGYGLPAALGAKVARPGSRVVLVTGDGSLQMAVQQLATIREENLGVKIVLLNNGYLGMVRQWQRLFYSRRYSAVALSRFPDFCALGQAYGLAVARVAAEDELDQALGELMAHSGPALVECLIEPEAEVFPIIPAGRGFADVLVTTPD